MSLFQKSPVLVGFFWKTDLIYDGVAMRSISLSLCWHCLQYVSFGKKPYSCRVLLRNRPYLSGSLWIVAATLYDCLCADTVCNMDARPLMWMILACQECCAVKLKSNAETLQDCPTNAFSNAGSSSCALRTVGKYETANRSCAEQCLSGTHL